MLTSFGEAIFGFVCGCVGGALVWHFKPFFQTFWRAAPAAVAALEAEYAALAQAIAALKAKL